MLSIANNAVANVDYSKTSKSLEGLIKKYNEAVKSIEEMNKALDKLAGTSSFDKLNVKIEATKAVINGLKSEIQGVLTPILKEVKGVVNSFKNFIKNVTEMINVINILNKDSKNVENTLKLFGGVLVSVALAFGLVALASSKIKMANGIANIFSGIVSVLKPLCSLLNSFKDSNLSLGTALGLLIGVLLGVAGAFGAVAIASSKISKIDGIKAIFSGLKGVLSSLGGILDSFTGSNKSLSDVLLVLGTSLGGVVVAFGAIALVSGKLKNIEGIKAIFAGIIGILQQLSVIIDAFAASGQNMWSVVGVLGTALLGLAAAVLIIAAATNVIDQEGLAGIEMILTSLLLSISLITELINAFSESGLSLAGAIGLLITVFGSVLILGAALIGGAAILANNPQYLIALEKLTNSISAILQTVASTLPVILDSCGSFITSVAPYLIELLTTIGKVLTDIIYALGTTLPPIIVSVAGLFSSIFGGIKTVIEAVGNVLVNILNTLKSLVTTVLDSILNFINKLGPAINNFVDNVIRAITKVINFIVSGIEYLVNMLFIGSINSLIKAISNVTEFIGVKIPTIKEVKLARFVPKLAQGAVIPPRHEFLAVLGDQKHGTNIEAPLETIKEANREVLKEFGNVSSEVILKNLTLVAQFGDKEFKKMVVDSVRLREKNWVNHYL